jgi:hypothetical protein
MLVLEGKIICRTLLLERGCILEYQETNGKPMLGLESTGELLMLHAAEQH